MNIAQCPYRTPTAKSHSCMLATEIVGRNVDVNDATCKACCDFFPSSRHDWNPIVASLVRSAAIEANNHDLADRAFPSLWHAPSDAYIEISGELKRANGGLPVCGKHRNDSNESSKSCLHFVREFKQLIGTGAHRSGWPFAMEAIASLACGDGILFDDFVEQRMCYHYGTPGYKEPWIGVIHHPPAGDPHFLSKRYSLEQLFESKVWADAKKNLKGVIALSEHLACYLRERLDVPIHVVKHPGADDVPRWSLESFRANPTKQLIQLGWFGRNSSAIYQLPNRPGFTYVRVLPNGEYFEQYDRNVESYNRKRGVVRIQNSVTERTRLTTMEIRSMHTKNVVLTEMLSASANNVIIDCIASCTPIIINRHPAVVEYIGSEYPLFFDNISEADSLLDEGRLSEASEYLSQMDRSWLTQESFLNSMTQAISSIQNG